MTKILVFTLYLKVDSKLTTVNEMTRNLFVKQAKNHSQQILEGKNHDIERSHSKRCSKTSICEIGNYFWDNTIEGLGEGNLTEEGFDEGARNDFDKKYFDAYNAASNLLNDNASSSAVSLSHTYSNRLLNNDGSNQTENQFVNHALNGLSDNFKLPSFGLSSQWIERFLTRIS